MPAFILGYLGGLCILSCRIPQLVKILQSKSARDVSLWMYILASLGGILWFTYGLMTRDWVLVVSNCIIGCIDVAILISKVKWG